MRFIATPSISSKVFGPSPAGFRRWSIGRACFLRRSPRHTGGPANPVQLGRVLGRPTGAAQAPRAQAAPSGGVAVRLGPGAQSTDPASMPPGLCGFHCALAEMPRIRLAEIPSVQPSEPNNRACEHRARRHPGRLPGRLRLSDSSVRSLRLVHSERELDRAHEAQTRRQHRHASVETAHPSMTLPAYRRPSPSRETRLCQLQSGTRPTGRWPEI